MIKPLQFIRLLQINLVLMRHALTRPVLGAHSTFLRLLSYLNPLSFFNKTKTRGESIRLALESLGPIFIKFGQVLSTRRDLLHDDIIDELEKLQDRVPSFPGKQAVTMIEQAFKQKISDIFATFDETPLASASIAQVHAATLATGEEVVVKVLRPKIERIIRQDIAILYMVAKLTERFWKQGKRLHAVGLVEEFENTILDELDLLREAASASQLRRNFIDSEKLYVPKIYWSHCKENIMVMERIHGIQISDKKTLKNSSANMKKLAENGVDIFFTQVFRDSFFHADMHPGNLFVDTKDPENPKYIGVDFGIMGTLGPDDQQYLAGNIIAFFNRDYRKVAVLHVESGWVPADTRIDQFESAIRTVCEPIFEKPLKDISFGQLLLRLFQTAERFNMEVQPQLMLLQKTLLSVEALGRQLYPELNLWDTAKPFMIRWMRENHSIRRLSRYVASDWYDNIERVLKTPGLLFSVLQQTNMQQRLTQAHTPMTSKPPSKASKKRSFIFGAGWTLAIVAAISIIETWNNGMTASQWGISGVAAGLLLVAWVMPKE